MISVFISSTFSNMQQERNLIQKYVFPEAEHFARKYGETIDLVDLRWGVDTSGMKASDTMKKIMTVCSSKIRDTFPCFIALLGEDYGTEVSVEEYPCTGITPGDTISITEYEIVTRLGMRKNDLAFFLRDDIRDVHHREEDLRQRISTAFPSAIHRYELSGPDSANDFVLQVTKVISHYVEQTVSSSPQATWYRKWVLSQASLLVERPDYLIKLRHALNTGIHSLILTGPDGIGKRSILYRFIADSHCNVIGVSAANTETCPDMEYLYDDLYDQLLPLLGDSFALPVGNISAVEKLRIALRFYAETEHEDLFVVIEEVEKFVPYGIKSLVQFPFSDKPRVYVICTARSFDRDAAALIGLINYTVITVDYLHIDEKKEFINKLFSSRAKQLPKIANDQLCRKPLSGHPLFLSLVLRSMQLLEESDFQMQRKQGSHDTGASGDLIAEALAAYIGTVPDTMEELYVFLRDRCESRTDRNLTELIRRLIASVKFGLREKDLKAVSEAFSSSSTLDFYYVFHYLSFLFSSDRLGRYTFKGADHISKNEDGGLRQALVSYLEMLPIEDPVRSVELPYLYATCGRFKKCIAEFSVQSDWTPEKQTVFVDIITEYESGMCNAIAETEPFDRDALHRVAILVFELSRIKYTPSVFKNVCSLLDTITKQFIPLMDEELCLADMFMVFSFAGRTAAKIGCTEQEKEWNRKAERFFLRMQQVKLSEEHPELCRVFEAVKLHLQVMNYLQKARKCLDNDLPEVLCEHLLNNIGRELRLIKKVSDIPLGKAMIKIIGVIGSEALYHELSGDLLMKRGDDDDALEHYLIALSMQQNEPIQRTANYAVFLMKIGRLFENKGKLDEAMQCYTEASEECQRLYSSSPTLQLESDYALTLCRISSIYLQKGDTDTAYRILNDACAVFKSIYERIHSVQSAEDYAICLFKIGELICSAGDKNRFTEGCKAVMKSFNLMQQISKKTGSAEWTNNMFICMKLIERLGGISE